MTTEANDHIPLRTVPDLRGLEAEDASGLRIGRLWGALAEADTGLLRYLDLQLERRPRHVLVPIGHTRIRGQAPAARVRLRAALLEELETIPAYEPDAAEISDPYERALLEAHGRAYHGEKYYAHPAYDHSGLFAGDHPIVPSAPHPAASARLVPLTELGGYRVAEGEADIRGWQLCAASDEALGVVYDLIVDPAAEKARYVVVETPAGGGRHFVLPVGYVQIDGAERRAYAPALAAGDAAALPGWTGGALDRTDEEAIRVALANRLSGRRRYRSPDFATSVDAASAFEERGA